MALAERDVGIRGYIVFEVRDKNELIPWLIGPCTKEASDVPAGSSTASAQMLKVFSCRIRRGHSGRLCPGAARTSERGAAGTRIPRR